MKRIEMSGKQMRKVEFWVGRKKAQGIVVWIKRDPSHKPHGVLIKVITTTRIVEMQQCYWPDGQGGRTAVVALGVVEHQGKYIATIAAFL